MIKAYDKAATAFNTLGLGAITPLKCIVSEELNGGLSFELEHPKDSGGKWQRLIEGNILTMPTPAGEQPFRIMTVDKNMKGNITAFGYHLTYDLRYNMIEDKAPTQRTGNEAINDILSGTAESHPFTASSDITIRQNARYVRVDPIAALIGPNSSNNSFIERWGGEIARDGYHISINSRRGADRGYQIRYKKNMSALNMSVDMMNVITKIMPTGLTAENSSLLLPEKYITSPKAGNYHTPIYKEVHFGDIKVGAEVDGAIPYPTVATAYTELRRRANALFEAGADVPATTLKVDFVDLSKTAEYKDLQFLTQLELGDDVRVIYDEFNIDEKQRVVSYKYNAVSEKYISLVIGDKPVNIGQTINSATIDLSVLSNTVSGAVIQGTRYNEVYITNQDGVVCETNVNGSNVKVVMNAYDGFAIYVNGVKKNWINASGLIAQRMSNDPTGSHYFFVGTASNGYLGSGFVSHGIEYINIWPDVSNKGHMEFNGGGEVNFNNGDCNVNVDGRGNLNFSSGGNLNFGGTGNFYFNGTMQLVYQGSNNYTIDMSNSGIRFRKNGVTLEQWS